MPVLDGNSFFNSFVSSITGSISRVLAHYFGPVAAAPVLGPISWADICAALIPILVVVLVNIALTLTFHRQSNKAPHARHWRRLVFGNMRGPIYSFIWLLAAYLALEPFLIKLWTGQRLRAIENALDEFFTVGALLALLWLCIRLTRIVETRLEVWAEKFPGRAAHFVVPLVGRSLRALAPALIVIFAWPLLGISQRYETAFDYFAGILIILVIGWILGQAVDIGEKALLAQYDIRLADNLRARKIYTQARLISRTLHVTIAICVLASILMLFQEVRHVGATMLTSAGIIGIVAGIAAQKTLANVIAGFQIALAQPVRHDDVVIVEGEWGRIEEITLTYVVVRIWDERRMVLPLTYFIEKPFQNWTRTTSTLLGSVFVWVDYTFPVDEGRTALKGIIENHPLWDKRFWNLQVSDADEKTMQLRILATSADSSKSWDLRCAIREQFISFIQKNFPHCLPRLRAELDGRVGGNGPDGRDNALPGASRQTFAPNQK